MAFRCGSASAAPSTHPRLLARGRPCPRSRRSRQAEPWMAKRRRVRASGGLGRPQRASGDGARAAPTRRRHGQSHLRLTVGGTPMRLGSPFGPPRSVSRWAPHGSLPAETAAAHAFSHPGKGLELPPGEPISCTHSARSSQRHRLSCRAQTSRPAQAAVWREPAVTGSADPPTPEDTHAPRRSEIFPAPRD
jgi:hypothetical protein